MIALHDLYQLLHFFFKCDSSNQTHFRNTYSM